MHNKKDPGWILTLAALGVVFGDIGTSPLYALRECFHGSHAVALTVSNILGILSLIIWALVLVITLKYLVFVMRANNRGEGGIMALMALAQRKSVGSELGRSTSVVVTLGLFGAALLYGDGMITPAISVLSAVEGLRLATPLFEPYVIPITVVILTLLFWYQHRGTASLGSIFGPIMLIWFFTLALIGLSKIVHEPAVLVAVNPWYAVNFFIENGWHGFAVLGSVFLVVTGGEALYADMGHFGKRAIERGWLLVAFPALVLQYLGQGALLIQDPSAIENLFFRMAPLWALYPLVALATVATVIASQAMLTGAFSLSRQAVQLGFLPHLEIRHTSASEQGQIYVPAINWLMFVGTIWIVLEFQSSTRLAAAYGIAVTLTMIITTLLTYLIARRSWGWSLPLAGLVSVVFLIPDLFFFSANALKILHGGWLPLAIASVVFFIMTTWKKGRTLLAHRLNDSSVSLQTFLTEIVPTISIRVPGVAVFMSAVEGQTPAPLLQNVRHNKLLHEKVICLTVLTENIPHVIAKGAPIQLVPIGAGIYQSTLRYGFMDTPDIPAAFEKSGLVERESDVVYFLGRRTVLATDVPGMAIWRERVFSFLARNSQMPSGFFNIPSGQVIEIGSVVDL